MKLLAKTVVLLAAWTACLFAISCIAWHYTQDFERSCDITLTAMILASIPPQVFTIHWCLRKFRDLRRQQIEQQAQD